MVSRDGAGTASHSPPLRHNQVRSRALATIAQTVGISVANGLVACRVNSLPPGRPSITNLLSIRVNWTAKKLEALPREQLALAFSIKWSTTCGPNAITTTPVACRKLLMMSTTTSPTRTKTARFKCDWVVVQVVPLVRLLRPTTIVCLGPWANNNSSSQTVSSSKSRNSFLLRWSTHGAIQNCRLVISNNCNHQSICRQVSRLWTLCRPSRELQLYPLLTLTTVSTPTTTCTHRRHHRERQFPSQRLPPPLVHWSVQQVQEKRETLHYIAVRL